MLYISDYAGDACDLAKDWCLQNPCKNNGECVTVSPRGFRCVCPPGLFFIQGSHGLEKYLKIKFALKST